MGVPERFKRIRTQLPDYVDVVVAAKSREPGEVLKVVRAGARIIGENYVQEAEMMKHDLGADADTVVWHFIGHLQRNKVRRALKVFDVIQTVDSFRLAERINRLAQAPVKVLVQVNIGNEHLKHGFAPSEVIGAVQELGLMNNLRINGLMAMEPFSTNAEDARHYFKKMKALFDKIKLLDLDNVNVRTLSMGMSNAYKVAISEGSNMVRIGTEIFGPRES